MSDEKVLLLMKYMGKELDLEPKILKDWIDNFRYNTKVL